MSIVAPKIRPKKKPIDEEPDPSQEYVPPEVDHAGRRDRLIDLADRNVLFCARTLSRMRIWKPDPDSTKRVKPLKAYLQEAPMDWWEYYSNINVEQWIFMWVLAFTDRLGKDALPCNPVFQYHIKGPYTIRNIKLDDGQDLSTGLKGGKEVSAAFLDFAWLPKNKNSSSPIVILECDENAHYTAGWDAERYREVFVCRELRKQYKNNQSILMIRFNPHERIEIPKSNKQKLPNVFTLEPSRNQRMAYIRELVLWGLGLPVNHHFPIKPGITIAFAYYDRWYEDETWIKSQDIHYHHFDSLRDFLTDVNRAAGKC